MKKKKDDLKPAIPGKQPGYWVNKTNFDMIKQKCASPRQTETVYLRLNRIMAERNSPTFKIAPTWIAFLCGLTQQRVEEACKELKHIGLIKQYIVRQGNFRTPYVTITGEVRYE